MLRIGVDGFNMAMPRGTGVATYGRTLTQALKASGHTIDVLYGAPVGPDTVPLLREIQFFDALDREGGRKAPLPGTPRWLRELATRVVPPTAFEVPVTGRVETRPFAARMPSFDRILNIADLFDAANRYFRRWSRFLTVRIPAPVPDIMHWTYPLPLRLEGARNIYTLHDLVPLRLPYTTLDNKRTYLRLLRGCVRWGDHICTVSDSSRRDIIDILGVPADRVTNTYQSSQMAQAPAETATREGLAAWLDGLFGLTPNGYFLFFGALEPKKNLGRLIEAHLSANISLPLVIVGGRAWKSEGELRLIQPRPGETLRKQTAGRIQQLDYVPATWLSGLIRGARAVVFPSLYEGFGLPVLEAMQAGTPVLTSNQSSLPEVVGDAGLLVDPYATDAIRAGLELLASDGDTCERLGLAGRVQAAQFGLEQYDVRLAEMYRSISQVPSHQAMRPD